MGVSGGVLNTWRQALGDDPGGMAGTAEGAGDDLGLGGFRQQSQPAPDRLGLRDTLGSQRRVEPALVAPDAVPFGLAVPHQQHRASHFR